MAGQSSELVALIAHITRRWPRMTAPNVEELAQEAFARALGADRALRGADLITKAKEAMETMGRDAHWRKKREGFLARPAAGDAGETGTSGAPAPRAPRRVGSRRPKGVVSYHAWETGFELHESEFGKPPNHELRLAAHLLRSRVFSRIEAGEPVSANVAEKALQLFEQLFGNRPLQSWASVLIQQVAAAKLSQITSTEEKRGPIHAKVGSTLTGWELEPDGSKTQRTISIRGKIASLRGARAVVGFYGDMGKGQGEQLLLTVVGTYGATPVKYPAAPRERAYLVLMRAIGILARFPVPCPIPEYALDVELVHWLELRMGFQGGGGRHSLTKDRLLELLLDPEALATTIEAHGTRMANRADELTGQRLENATTDMAARVRSRAGTTAGE